MNIREMHYDFKMKLNKIDSQKYRNLLVPEIDWKLNEAQEAYIKIIAEPRLKNGFGFEINQRSIDDLRTLVVNQTLENSSCLVATKYDDESYLVQLPTDYMFYVSSEVVGSKGSCTGKKLSSILRQHDDKFKNSPFDNSSFEWREANIRFFEDGIRIFTDGTFTVSNLCLNYIRKPLRLSNALSAYNQEYRDLSGNLLTTNQDSELPAHTHSEIVDLAVLITTGDLQIPDYQIKQNKLKIIN